MTFDQIKQSVKDDLKIEMDNLVNSSIETPNIYNKYLKEYYSAKEQLSRYKMKYDSLYRDRWLYYSGKADPAVYAKDPFNLKIMKNEVSIFLDGDKSLSDMKYKLEYIEQKIGFLKGILNEISKRSFVISNIIKTLKFQNGEF